MFHRIWLSDGDRRDGPPAAYDANWAAWQRQFPERQFKTWTEDDIGSFEDAALHVRRAEGMARKADILRYAILEKIGGVYLDCDIEPYHRPDNLDQITDVLVCNEDQSLDYCSIGFIAAPPGRRLFRTLIDEIGASPLNARDPNLETGPHLFGRHLKREVGVRRLPTSSYYPYHVHEPRSAILGRDLGGTVGIHQWGASWASDQQHQSTLASRVLQGDAVEIEAAVKSGRITEDAPLVALSRDLRKLREGYAHLAMTFSDRLAPFELGFNRCFDFLKVLYWLERQKFDITIWQVGAADGVLVDPLRPFMVMFDPKAVLIEPNPWMFSRLQKNYGLNSNISFVPAALAEQDGDVVLNCVIPEEVQKRNLPEWVLGISSVYSNKNALDGRDLPPELHGEIQQAVRRETVEGLSVQSVRARTGADLPSVLVVDAEGMDAQIIVSIMRSGAKPYLIHFEHCNLDDQEKIKLDETLRVNYIVFTSGNDATAIRKDVLLTYCRDVWVEHGIQSIFTLVFEAVNPFRR